MEKNCGNFLAQIVERLCGILLKKPGFFLSPFIKSVIFLYFLTSDVEFMTGFYDFLKNLRIFDNFPKYFGGIFFTPYFSHFIAFLLLNISGQIVEKFHNCGKFGHPNRAFNMKDRLLEYYYCGGQSRNSTVPLTKGRRSFKMALT